MYCFTSRIARKSESVGRNKFVNVMYEYHYKVMNIIIRIMNFIIFDFMQLSILDCGWQNGRWNQHKTPGAPLYFSTDPQLTPTRIYMKTSYHEVLYMAANAHAHFKTTPTNLHLWIKLAKIESPYSWNNTSNWSGLSDVSSSTSTYICFLSKCVLAAFRSKPTGIASTWKGNHKAW